MKGQIAMRNAREDTGRRIMTFKGGMIMKKVLSIIASIIAAALIIVMLPGCELGEGNIPPSLTQKGYDAEAAVTKLKTKINDRAFWDSIDKAADLIEATLEKRAVSIDTRISCSDGSSIILPDYKIDLKHINDVWRSIASNGLICAVAQTKKVVEAHEAGKTTKVTGIILRWTHTEWHLFSTNVRKVISVFDLEGDGAWDYVVEGRAFFTDSDIVSLEGENGEKIGIGIENIGAVNLVPVKEATTLDELYRRTQST